MVLVETTNGVLYLGRGRGVGGGMVNVIHDFWYWEKRDEGDTKLKYFTFDLFTLNDNIH